MTALWTSPPYTCSTGLLERPSIVAFAALSRTHSFTREKPFPKAAYVCRTQPPIMSGCSCPPYLYKRYPITGADFAGPRAALQRAGLTCHFVETDEDGAIETNEDIVGAASRSL